MMKPRNHISNLRLAIQLLLALCLVNCLAYPSLARVHSMYEFGNEFLPLNERIDYVISSFDEENDGKGIFTIKKITQLDIDMLLIRYEGSIGERKEKWEIKLVKEDLSPFSFELTFEEPDRTHNYTGNVSGRDITMYERATGRDPREVIMSRGGNFYLSMMLPYLLRNLDFAIGDWFTFSLLQVEQGKFITPIVQVKEREVIEVPAGLYECWKVSVKLGTEQHFGWYSIKEPHFLVRYRYSGKEFNMERHY